MTAHLQQVMTSEESEAPQSEGLKNTNGRNRIGSIMEMDYEDEEDKSVEPEIEQKKELPLNSKSTDESEDQKKDEKEDKKEEKKKEDREEKKRLKKRNISIKPMEKMSKRSFLMRSLILGCLDLEQFKKGSQSLISRKNNTLRSWNHSIETLNMSKMNSSK